MKRTANEIIRKLTAAAAAPGSTIRESCQKTGKPAVGFVAPYGPEEIAYAAGCLPVGLWGGQVELKRARAYLPAFACSIMQSIVELAAGGVYDDLAAVVIPSPCDTLKCIGQKWKGKSPAIQFTHPMNRRLDCANDYLTSEYQGIRTKLEGIVGRTITDEALTEAILVYNRYRTAMREFTQVAREHLSTISPTVRHGVIKAAHFMDKAEYTRDIEDLTQALRKAGPEPWEGKRVVLTGITFEPQQLLEILEFYHVAVAGDDVGVRGADGDEGLAHVLALHACGEEQGTVGGALVAGFDGVAAHGFSPLKGAARIIARLRARRGPGPPPRRFWRAAPE